MHSLDLHDFTGEVDLQQNLATILDEGELDAALVSAGDCWPLLQHFLRAAPRSRRQKGLQSLQGRFRCGMSAPKSLKS